MPIYYGINKDPLIKQDNYKKHFVHKISQVYSEDNNKAILYKKKHLLDKKIQTTNFQFPYLDYKDETVDTYMLMGENLIIKTGGMLNYKVPYFTIIENVSLYSRFHITYDCIAYYYDLEPYHVKISLCACRGLSKDDIPQVNSIYRIVSSPNKYNDKNIMYPIILDGYPHCIEDIHVFSRRENTETFIIDRIENKTVSFDISSVTRNGYPTKLFIVPNSICYNNESYLEMRITDAWID